MYRKPTTGESYGPGSVDSSESFYERETQMMRKFGGNPLGLVASATHRNIRALAHQRLKDFAYVGQGDYAQNALKTTPVITKRMIGKVYDIVKRKLTGKKGLDPLVVLSYFSVRSAPGVVRDLLVTPLEELEALQQLASSGRDQGIDDRYISGSKTPSNVPYDPRSHAYKAMVRKYVDDLIEQQV